MSERKARALLHANYLVANGITAGVDHKTRRALVRRGWATKRPFLPTQLGRWAADNFLPGTEEDDEWLGIDDGFSWEEDVETQPVKRGDDDE